MRLGQILLQRGVLKPEELAQALELQLERPDKLGRILCDIGCVSARDVLSALSEQLRLPVVPLDSLPDVAEIPSALAPRFLERFRCIPCQIEGDKLTLAMADPLDFETITAIEACTGLEVQPALAAESAIADAHARLFPSVPEIAAPQAAEAHSSEDELEHLRDIASEAPVIRMVNAAISQAVEQRASDIHLEPAEREFRMRFRIDGELYNQDPPPREMRAAMVSRIKLMSKLNIAEQRLPQDGRVTVKSLGRDIDLRVSTMPTLYGESVVMRLLDRSQKLFDLRTLGLDNLTMARMQRYASLCHGMVLVTGPTGSGKSTTLYSVLRQIDRAHKKIITIEDPVEYQMEGINQIHVNPQIGLTFASGLRHILRQDPDVVMVGEIRDSETASIAVRAALTGHLVLSTLHTNDAASAIVRLIDMGIEKYLLTSSIVAIMAQRLVRVICPSCKEEISKEEAGPAESPDGDRFPTFAGRGCAACLGTGFQGRVGVFEMLEIEDELRSAILAGADASRLSAIARQHGMLSLREDAWRKVKQGLTTPGEAMRATQET